HRDRMRVAEGRDFHVAIGNREVDARRMPAAIAPDRAAGSAEERIPAIAAWIVFLVVVHAAAEAGADRHLRARHPRHHVVDGRFAAAAKALTEEERIAGPVLLGHLPQSGFGAVRDDPFIRYTRIVR